jgi:hypothetical protein
LVLEWGQAKKRKRKRRMVAYVIGNAEGRAEMVGFGGSYLPLTLIGGVVGALRVS